MKVVAIAIALPENKTLSVFSMIKKLLYITTGYKCALKLTLEFLQQFYVYNYNIATVVLQ